MSSLGDELGAGEKQENKLKWQAIGNYPWICQNLSGLAPNKQRTIFIFGYEYTQNWRWQAPAYGNSSLRRRKCQEFGLGSINAGSDSSAACPEIWLFMKCLSRVLAARGVPTEWQVSIKIAKHQTNYNEFGNSRSWDPGPRTRDSGSEGPTWCGRWQDLESCPLIVIVNTRVMSVIKTPHSISFCRPAIKGVFIGNGLGGGGLARDLHNAEQYGRAWQLFLHAHNLMTTMSWHNNEMRLQAFGPEPHVNFILLTLRISRLTQNKKTHTCLGGFFHCPNFVFLSFSDFFFGFSLYFSPAS